MMTIEIIMVTGVYNLTILVVRRNVAIRSILFSNDSIPKCVSAKNWSLEFIVKRITKAGRVNKK